MHIKKNNLDNLERDVLTPFDLTSPHAVFCSNSQGDPGIESRSEKCYTLVGCISSEPIEAS